MSHPSFSNYYVAIMAGGVGSRFWPQSRQKKPKQFLSLAGTHKSLLQMTFDRFRRFIAPENIFVVTFKDYVGIVGEQIPELDKNNILAEPMRKNTAPCIAYTAFKLRERNPQAVLLCAPADHYIHNEEAFEASCIHALSFCHKNEQSFVTIGIQPSYPNTGFGYIQFIKEAEGSLYKVKTFTEKPNKELATYFVESGEFLWNAGIFIASQALLISSYEKYLPEVYDLFEKHRTFLNTQLEASALDTIYPHCPNISFDYAIMEKTSNVFVLPAAFDWNDLGTWNSLYELNAKDEHANVLLSAPVLSTQAQGNIVRTEGEKLVVLRGLDNFIIVDTKDVLMIYPRSEEQEIKNLTEDLKVKKLDKYL